MSGINKGWNLGDDVTYSGTVSGALEGALLGVPSIAVSLQAHARPHGFLARPRGRRLGWPSIVLTKGLPPRTFLNINVPRRVTHGFKVTCRRSATT